MSDLTCNGRWAFQNSPGECGNGRTHPRHTFDPRTVSLEEAQRIRHQQERAERAAERASERAAENALGGFDY